MQLVHLLNEQFPWAKVALAYVGLFFSFITDHRVLTFVTILFTVVQLYYKVRNEQRRDRAKRETDFDKEI